MVHFEEMVRGSSDPYFQGKKENYPELPPTHNRYVVLSDMHGDCFSARASLEERGILNRKGEWKKGVAGVHLMITGDSVDKSLPDTEMFHFLRHLQKTAIKNGENCKVTTLIGNHEIDLLLRGIGGENCLKKKDIEFLQTCGVVYKNGPVLFLHGYPTRELIQELAMQYEENGGDVEMSDWWINRRFSGAVADLLERGAGDLSTRETLRSCNFGNTEEMLGGLTKKKYYEKYGEEIADLMKRMGVTLVVHGHKKNISGGQEIERYNIPGVCMINDDVALSHRKNPQHTHRMGLVEITTNPNNEKTEEVTFFYKGNMDSHKQVKKTSITIH